MEDLVTEFNGLLAQHLKRGQLIEIDVKPAKNPKKYVTPALESFRSKYEINSEAGFHITLATEKLNKNPDAQIGLNVLVQYDGSVISLHGQWGKVRPVYISSHLANEDIKVIILMCDTCFKISINGEYILEMVYRNDAIDHLKAIQIGGDVKLITRVDHRKIYPSIWPPGSFVQYYPTAMALSNDIPIRFTPGHLMVLTGRCYGSPEYFFLNLKHGHNETQILHMKVNFKSRTVSRNACNPTISEYFGHEYVDNEYDGGFPFDFNKTFKIGIACKETKFLIAVNGKYFCSYDYRDPANYHPNGIAPRPYKNVLSNIVGIKIFQSNGLGVKFTDVDHILLDNPECIDFEKYTKNICECNDNKSGPCE